MRMFASTINPKMLGAMALSFLLVACADSGTSSTSSSPSPDDRQAITGTDDADITTEPLPGLGDYEPGSSEELEAFAGQRVFFGYDRYDLTLEAQKVLRNQAAWMRRYPNKKVVSEGHCDERGTREYNLALGARRASSAKRYLVVLGIDPSRIRTISYGKERPEEFASNPAVWAKNRRAFTEVE